MNYSKIDLHCHSSCSDGALSPEDLLARASEKGVECLALTDHDTIAGQKRAIESSKQYNIKMVTGIELSCVWSNYTVHVLGLNFSLENGVMADVESRQTSARMERAQIIADKLHKKGLPHIYQEACLKSATGIPGRPHFAEVLLEKEIVTSMGEAFKKYLGSGKTGDVKGFWPDLETVTEWIRSAEGTAVIAHPRKYDMTLTKLRKMLGLFKECGGEGIEVITSGQKQGEIGMLSDVCQRMDLKGSIGSDFHSPKFAWAELGRVPKLPVSVEPVWSEWGLDSNLWK
ncbi:MAG: putative metal-dependent phosphoesterase TrpH [Oleiphilaceae bacterium]|jgi:predicted metal-dependent phosphoesterase TrpH